MSRLGSGTVEGLQGTKKPSNSRAKLLSKLKSTYSGSCILSKFGFIFILSSELSLTLPFINLTISGSTIQHRSKSHTDSTNLLVSSVGCTPYPFWSKEQGRPISAIQSAPEKRLDEGGYDKRQRDGRCEEDAQFHIPKRDFFSSIEGEVHRQQR